MKTADVKIGGVYRTQIGDRTVRVRITDALYMTGMKRSFLVERLDGGRPTPSHRYASALTETTPDGIEESVKDYLDRLDLSVTGGE